MALDLAPRGDIKCLPRVLAVANVRADDVDALHDGEEDVRAETGASGETDNHERATHSEVVDRLCVGLRVGGGDNRGMRTVAVRGLDDVLNEILCLAEVDPLLCAEAETELLFIGAGVCGCVSRVGSGSRREDVPTATTRRPMEVAY